MLLDWLDPSVEEPPMRINGNDARYPNIPEDVYDQPGNFFRLFNDEQKKERLFQNIAIALQGVS
ncbi:MAG: hypothetical protein AMJ53_00775 [Gammaproteobacteria bacterium SG8_11]|nr:MAG: hypothetical protein AMJ53_00775 [Gammaproteobacteria bacterium SG8_11]